MNVKSPIYRYACVLSIAGSDSGGGAGIQADLKTFSALGCFGMSAITALTAQNTQGVSAIHVAPPEIVRAQIDAVVEDIGVDAVKVGMLHSIEIVAEVREALERHQLTKVILDPVMIATNGAVLIDQPAITALVRQLFPRALLITPNLDEAALLVGNAIDSEVQMFEAAQRLLSMGAKAVLLKGGHLIGDIVSDLYLDHHGQSFWLRAPRVDTPNTHGTGCTLSSAIAAHLARGETLKSAIRLAHDYVHQALIAGKAVRTGFGSGPLNHASKPHPMQLTLLPEH